jgi:hypothetical protein
MIRKPFRFSVPPGEASRTGKASRRRTGTAATPSLVACVLLVMASVGYGQTVEVPELAQEPSELAAAAAVAGYRIAYTDKDGLVRTVNEDGTDDRVLVDLPVGRFHTADPNHGGAIVTLAYNDLYWQIFNYTEDGRQIRLATSKGKNVFMAYDSVYRRVYYARNYSAEQRKGDFYSVALTGGTSTLLANAAIWGDVIGDRLVFLQGWSGNKNIYSIRHNGTGLVGLATANADETYVGRRGSLVIFTRVTTGTFTNLYAIPVAGGSQVTLDSTGAKKAFAGNGAERIYYYRDYGDGRDVCSVLPNGTGRVNLTSFKWDYWHFAGEGVDRVGLFVDGVPRRVSSVTKSGTSPVEFPCWGDIPHEFLPTVFHNRMVHVVGGHFAYTTRSQSLTGDDEVDLLTPVLVTALSWPSKRIIVSNTNGDMLYAFNAEGRNRVRIGATYPFPEFEQSTGSRHLFSNYVSHDPDGTPLSNLCSVRLDGSSERVVIPTIPTENLDAITIYYLNFPSR